MFLKVKDIIKIIEKDGWQLARISGSHRHYTHNIKKCIVMVPGKLCSDVAKGTKKKYF